MLQVLWERPSPAAAKDALAALGEREGTGAPRELAITTVLTVLTVLDRLRRKGLVRRERSGRAHLYQAVVSREAYVAGLMLEALGQAPDRSAALTRFLGSVTADDTDHLRRALGGQPARARPGAAVPAAAGPEARSVAGAEAGAVGGPDEPGD